MPNNRTFLTSMYKCTHLSDVSTLAHVHMPVCSIYLELPSMAMELIFTSLEPTAPWYCGATTLIQGEPHYVPGTHPVHQISHVLKHSSTSAF